MSHHASIEIKDPLLLKINGKFIVNLEKNSPEWVGGCKTVHKDCITQ